LKDEPERTPLSEQSLEEIVDDLDQDVLARTVSAQDELVRRGKEVRSSIEAALRSNDLSKGQRTWLAWALGRISMEDSSIDHFFIGRLKDESSPLDIRVQSLRILAHRVRFNDSGRALPDEVVRFLNDENPRLRFEAVQALWRSRCSDKSEPLLEALAKEEDRLVYYALWGALRDLLSIQDRKQILTTHPSSAVRFGMLLGLLENGELEGEEVVQILQSDEDARIQTWASAWLAQVGHGLEEPGQVIQKLLELNRRGINYELRMNLLASLERMEVSGQDWTDLYEGFYANHRKGEIYVPEKSQEAALCLRVLSRDERSLPILWEALSHEWAPVRRAAIESFRNLGEKGRDFLLTRFDAIEDPQLRGAIEALSRFDHRNEPWLGSDKQVERIVEACSRSDDPLFRQKALQLLVMAAPETWKRPASKSYAVSLVHGAMNDPDPRIYLLGEDLAKLVGEEVHAVRREPATLEGVLAKIETANLDNGKRLFFQEGGRAACYRCHRVGALGNNFAPDLTDIGGRLDRRKLAESILDPNAEITEGYRARLLETLDGEVLTGVILRETETFLDLAQSDGETARIEKGDIVEQRNLETSIMPSNYAELLSSQELADIAAWLMSATPAPEKR